MFQAEVAPGLVEKPAVLWVVNLSVNFILSHFSKAGSRAFTFQEPLRGVFP